MFLGPVFAREAVTTPRQARHFAYRAIYVAVLLLLTCTAWLVLAGTQIIRNVGDMSRFGTVLFAILAPLQLALVTFFAALGSASAVCQEKDRRTLILLLLTRLRNGELVLGKLAASLLNVLVMLAAAVPVFMLITLFGGISFGQVFRAFSVTLVTVLAAGSLGSTIALSREKTFQALALTALCLVLWVGFGELLGAEVLGAEVLGISSSSLAVAVSPFRAILAAARPAIFSGDAAGLLAAATTWYVALTLLGTGLLNAVAIRYVRVWNPSREVRPGVQDESERASIWGTAHDLKVATAEIREAAEKARSGHVDARQSSGPSASRRVWDNPVLWREVCTWAYGKKVLIIRVIYLALFVLASVAARTEVTQFLAQEFALESPGIVPAAAGPMAALFLVSLVMINSLAVTSITNERDGQAIDLLLVTDLSPREFVFGKLGGVLWVTREMVLLPMLLSIYLWWLRGMTLENLLFTVGGLAVMDVFVAMLGIHCGMHYANSRSAISISLGTVFFLFLGVLTCMTMMVSFSGSFHNQLAPFLAFILGGSVGLYVLLGIRNPSQAIGLASLGLPFATFFAITSFLLRNQELTVFLVTTLAYGFTTLAMLIPAIGEFDFAMGRTKTAGDND